MGTEVAERGGLCAERERAWVTAAQQGDRQAFSQLVEVYWPRLFRWLFQLTHDRHTAEDLAQEAFLKALAHLHRFQAGTNFRAWLFRIAHNTYANQRRSTSRLRGTLPDDLPESAPGPEDTVLGRETLGRLADAVQQLPPDFRAALLLRVDEEHSFRDIATILNTTEETARWRVFKARQKLLELLDSEPKP